MISAFLLLATDSGDTAVHFRDTCYSPQNSFGSFLSLLHLVHTYGFSDTEVLVGQSS